MSKRAQYIWIAIFGALICGVLWFVYLSGGTGPSTALPDPPAKLTH
ncbi:hypothetical protein [Paraburkholderia diazotrophica]|uniref:Uncharacterized protein n=1 Tax=Paraburkholderia diazotrophica TaxID=667676 RepID=A0A1H6QLG0_9BURK|nr:hypothetical protein [Paraburkholderia diazotrophica]SEI42816.1 hypothetical protein SAMN05192539_1001333 [Paraburkholderia diazotrophica]